MWRIYISKLCVGRVLAEKPELFALLIRAFMIQSNPLKWKRFTKLPGFFKFTYRAAIQEELQRVRHLLGEQQR